ncbi:RTC4-like domain-containing protein [Neurospora tetraspora]|uniref:Restriction of telomere capping protein 4 n=1 Tax=Neurospora tetraspora TaxID=94610 RepID=A0AAE0MXI3_9PEZI|nr:RTC4-like domain-containing protein [Neurospora tetraspora]
MNDTQDQRARVVGLNKNQQLKPLLSTFRRPVVSENGPMFSEDTFAADVPVPKFRASVNDIGSSGPKQSNDMYIPKFPGIDRDDEDGPVVKKPQDMSVPRFKSASDNGHDPITRKDDVWLATEVPKFNDFPKSTGGGRDIAKSEKTVNVDDPPVSSSDDDDDDPFSNRGGIQPTFIRGQQIKKPALSPLDGDKLTTTEDEAVSGTTLDGSGYGKRNTRASASRKRTLGPLSDDDIEDDQPQKKAKTQTHKSEELGSHLKANIDAIMRWGAPRKTAGYGGKTAYGSKAKASAAKSNALVSNKKHIAAQKQQTRTPSTKSRTTLQLPTKVEILERPSPKLRIPRLFDALSGDQVSPIKKPMEKRKIRRAKPPRKRSQETGDMSSGYDLEDDETSDRAAADTTMPGSPGSPLSSLDSTFKSSRVVLCPMCDEEVDKSFFEGFKAKHPRMTLHQEQQFCQSHKRDSANKEWLEKGYPDIDWTVMDKRIKKHYDFLRSVLNGGESYYATVFSNKIKSGQNKTLLKSDGNLTPGYYGMRGLRIMSEHLVNNFSSELRNRAVQDRLVSKRGYMVYVQSVLVPELAVRLIMEDRIQQANQEVTEEEARNIMKDSVWVGELLNEEDADHVLYEDEEDEESQNDEMGLRDEDEAHLRYEYESKLKHEDGDKLKYEDQGSAKQEDEDVKSNGNVIIHIEDDDKVKSKDQDDAKQQGENIKSNGNGINQIKDEEDDDKLSISSLTSLSDLEEL